MRFRNSAKKFRPPCAKREGGVRREAEVGVRTTLDVLDAEQEYLDAQVALANAERDARATTYELLASIGAIHLQE